MAAGKIIGGRVTDANGLPIAGVKVSLNKMNKDGSVLEQNYLTMAVWNEPNVEHPFWKADENGKIKTVYSDFDLVENNNGILEEDELPRAEAFRNVTDANGIWAIDKVADGEYEIVLEKDGLNFAGKTAVKVEDNLWGLDFVGSTEENLE